MLHYFVDKKREPMPSVMEPIQTLNCVLSITTAKINLMNLRYFFVKIDQTRLLELLGQHAY